MSEGRYIRPFRRKDAPDYQAMAMDFYGGDATLYPMTEDKLTRSMETSLARPDRFAILMLMEGDHPAGYMALAFSYSTEAGGEVCWVEELYLKLDYRSQGWGEEALQWVLDQHPDIARFRLEVAPANPDARRLYERLGFVPLPYEQMVKEVR